MSSQNQHRIPPQALEVETSVLGAMMMEKESMMIALDMLSARDFFLPKHQHIFNTIRKLKEKSVNFDLLTIEHELKEKKLLELCGGSDYLNELTRSVSSAANIDYHAQILKEKSTLRNLIRESTELASRAYDPESDPYEILDQMKTAHRRIEDNSYLKIPGSSSQTAGKVLKETTEETNVDNGIVGVPTYLPIDLLTAGLPRKELIYIAARPSMGKTAYMLTIVKNLIENGFNKPIVIFSYEMDAEVLVLRLLCMMAQVNMHFAMRGKLEDAEKIKLANAASRLGVQAKWDHNAGRLEISSIEDSLLFIEDDNRTGIEQMEAKARRISLEHGELGIICLDYLQLVPVRNQKEKNLGTREQEVAYISRSLKTMAKDFNVPFLSLSQLSRAVENRSGDNRPMLSDLRESGSIEQDATMVMFLYRPEYYKIKRTEAGISTKGMCEVILAKSRNGPTGTEKHEFIKDYATFREWDEEAAAMRSGSGDPRERKWGDGVDDMLDDESPF